MHVEELERKIGEVGDQVRSLKASGGSKDEIGELVAELLSLKNQLPDGHELKPLPKGKQKEMAKEKKKSERSKRKKEELQRKKAMEKKLSEITLPTTQRKIFHLLEAREVDGIYRYVKSLNESVGLEEGSSVYLTEKWDGTTVQATKDGVFKRFDKFPKGDPRKRSTPIEDRYRLDLLDLELPDHVHIKKTVSPYLDIFKTLEDGLCVYFESVCDKIGARYAHIPGYADIRMFDASVNGKFVSFEEVVQIAEKYKLPLVGYEKLDDLNAGKIWDRLEAATKEKYGTVEADLEGFVVRSVGAGKEIAKIRTDTLEGEKVAV